MSTCPHCPDGHERPQRRAWAVTVGPERDHDDQPLTLHVGKTGCHHVAESDAAWLRQLLTAPLQIVQAGYMKGCAYVAGTCPSCHHETLALGSGGYVTCAYPHCVEPDAASKALGA